jgi:5-(carboxyamino)imidazole ribonucleotide synthase
MARFYSPDFKLGILGGGQLGRMFIQSAIDHDVHVKVLDPSPQAPCSEYASTFVVGDFNDYDTVLEFGKDVDVLTVEIEHVNVDALRVLRDQGVKVYPDPEILAIVQDKGAQKNFYNHHNIPTSPYRLVESNEIKESDLPIVQKLRRGGYDGRGVTLLRKPEDMARVMPGPSVLEELIHLETEVSVIAARNSSGDVKTFPLVELEFDPEANLVSLLKSPANVSEEVSAKAKALATTVVEAFDLVGIMAVEMFVTKEGDVLVNEVAPRTHNSGHHSIEGNITSQFEQHLRAILDLPLGNTDVLRPACMINLLGAEGHEGPVYYKGIEDVMAMSGVHVHIYGKSHTKPFRKMGHVTTTGATIEEALVKARRVQSALVVRTK